MKPASIRVRLTAWYFAVLAMGLGLFGAGMYFTARQSVHAAVDDELYVRLQGVQRLMQRELPGGDLDDLQREFREHSGLKPGGDLIQVADAQGNWMFQSGSIRPYKIALAKPPDSPQGDIQIIDVDGSPLRLLTARVEIEGRPYTVQLATALGGFYAVLHRLAWLTLWSIPAVLLLATAGGYWISRRALAPVDQLTHTARSISAHNLSQRLTVPQTGDELQRLAETLNEMMARLNAAFKRIVQFTADASHELRTPVALVRTTAEVALQKSRDASAYEGALRDILAEAERTSVLIEDLMTLARADSGAETLQFSEVDLGRSVREACSQGSTLAGPRDIEFGWQIPPEEMHVKGDPDALRRLFLILIDNALKYTPAGGRVSVSLARLDGFGVGEVRDSGMGIAAEDLPNIFERFYRADKAHSHDMGGAGLGLSIARWIVEAHHAEIQVESSPGQGSLFRVRIPVEKLSS
jgi:two-component system, OmpR family, heavy metal sensor histidine kinase CusS